MEDRARPMLDNVGLRVRAKATGQNPEVLREPQISEFVLSRVCLGIVPGRAVMAIRDLWPESGFFRPPQVVDHAFRSSRTAWWHPTSFPIPRHHGTTLVGAGPVLNLRSGSNRIHLAGFIWLDGMQRMEACSKRRKDACS